MAGQMVPTTTKMPENTNPAYVRQKLYDPYTQTYKSLAPVKAADWGSRNFSDAYANPQTGEVGTLQPRTPGMATGGIVALAAGGAGTDASTDPVAAPAGLTADEARKLVEAQYATIGRSGVGTGAGQIDETGLKNWTDALVGGTLKASDLGSRFGTAVTDYMAQNPADQYTQYVKDYQAKQAGTGTGTTGGITNLATTAADTSGIATLNNAGATTSGVDPATARMQVTNMYRNVLGRDPDPEGLAFWSNAIAGGRSPESIYQDFLTSAKANTELVRADQIGAKTFSEATTPYSGYTSTEGANIADEWVRNVLGREPTAVDKRQSWYQDTFNKMQTQDQAKALYNQFTDYAAKETGKATDLNWMAASQLKALPETKVVDKVVGGGGDTPIVTKPTTYAPPGTKNPYGNEFNPGDLTFNNDGTITVTPNIPGRPYGGFTGMDQVRNAYTRGGGSLGYTSPVVNTAAEHAARYDRLTNDSAAAYDYLMGKGANPIQSRAATSSTGIMRPYFTGGARYAPRYLTADSSGAVTASTTNPNTIQPAGTLGAKAINVTNSNGVTEVARLGGDGTYRTADGTSYNVTGQKITSPTPIAEAADGGIVGYADGGITGNGQLNLNIPLNLGGAGGSNGYSAAGGYQGQGYQNSVQQSGMPDFRNQMQGFDAQIQKLPSVMAYNDYTKSIGGRPPTAEEMAKVDQLRKGITGDQGFMDLQSQMQSIGNKYQQQAMGNQSPGLQQRYTQQSPTVTRYAAGGYAVGGGLGSLGSYSDGGRLLKGPGDGVSDSIPATIGAKQQPARLADGEFVVPARIVSELGNGSTDAGAKKLYAMMDRVQRARGKTTGKNKVAANSRADKHLPA
jgi:hypothetical protein